MRRADREILDRESRREIIDAADACRLGFAVGRRAVYRHTQFRLRVGESASRPLFPLRPRRTQARHDASQSAGLPRARRRARSSFRASSLRVGHEVFEHLGYGELRELVGDGERRNGLDRVMSHYGRRGEGTYAEATLECDGRTRAATGRDGRETQGLTLSRHSLKARPFGLTRPEVARGRTQRPIGAECAPPGARRCARPCLRPI